MYNRTDSIFHVNREVVGHDGLIPSCGEDGGGVDLHELSRVDSPVVFLQQVWPECARPDHHSEVRSECHAPSRASLGGRWVHSTRR
jgi:hypothetical protein